MPAPDPTAVSGSTSTPDNADPAFAAGPAGPADAVSDASSDAYLLTDVVTRLRRALRTSIRTEYPWESLPMAQVELMQSLSDQSPARVGDLAARQRLSASTVSGLISQLMTSGLVVRGTHPDDRRVAVVELTEAGRLQLADWQAAHQRRIGTALGLLSDADREAVAAALPALAKLVGHLAAGDAD